VIQNDIGNQHAATTIVAAITSTLKKYPVTVWLEKGEGGLKQESMANLSQVFALDRSRLQRKLGTLDEDRIWEVNEAISISLQLVEI
jgi:mRNA interferase MazF